MKPLFWVLPLFILSCVAKKFDPGPRALDEAAAPVHLVRQPVTGPAVWMQVTVRAGSAHDPVGKEGLAHLTAQLLREGGMGELGPQAVELALEEMGTDIQVVVDKELVSFRIQCVQKDAARAAALLGSMFKAPRFEASALDRLKGEGLEWLEDGLVGSDEQLGDEVFQSWMYQAHPYGHPTSGRSGVVGTIEVSDVIAYHSDRYVRPVMAVGVAGSVEESVLVKLVADLGAAPAKLYRDATPRSVSPVLERSMLIVTKQTTGTAIHFGHPTRLRQDHKDWPAMMLAVTALGELRQSRGWSTPPIGDQQDLSEGEHTYPETHQQAGWSTAQQPGTARVDNPFRVWVRPTTPDNAAFALKGAVDVVERWVADGLEPAEFERLKTDLQQQITLWAADPAARLAWALEARVMGWPNPVEALPAQVGALQIESVNAAIQAHIDPKRLRIVVVTEDADAFEAAVKGTDATPRVSLMAAPTIEPDSVAEDVRISELSLGIGEVNRVAADGVFR